MGTSPGCILLLPPQRLHSILDLLRPTVDRRMRKSLHCSRLMCLSSLFVSLESHRLLPSHLQSNSCVIVSRCDSVSLASSWPEVWPRLQKFGHVCCPFPGVCVFIVPRGRLDTSRELLGYCPSFCLRAFSGHTGGKRFAHLCGRPHSHVILLGNPVEQGAQLVHPPAPSLGDREPQQRQPPPP